MIKILLLASSALLVALPSVAAGQAQDLPEMLDAVMPHIRSFFPEGQIQFVPVGGETAAAMSDWAQRGGHEVGPEDKAVECRKGGGCRGIGSFRGFARIEIVEHARTAAILRVGLYQVREVYGSTRMRLDDIHLTRTRSGWAIDRIVLREQS